MKAWYRGYKQLANPEKVQPHKDMNMSQGYGKP